MTDAGVHATYYFIKPPGSSQTEPLHLDFSYHPGPFQLGRNAALSDREGVAPVARNEWSVRQLSQLAIEKVVCALVGECCSLSVVMCPTMPREGMILTRIAVDCPVRFPGKCRLDFSLCSFGNELVLLGQVHQQRRMKPVDFAQIFLSVTAVISNSSINATAHSCQKNHECAEAIAKDGDLDGAPWQLSHSVDGVLYIPDAGVAVIGLIQTHTVLPVGVGGDITKVNARLLPPKKVGRNRNITLFGQFVAGFADVGVYPEQLL